MGANNFRPSASCYCSLPMAGRTRSESPSASEDHDDDYNPEDDDISEKMKQIEAEAEEANDTAEQKPVAELAKTLDTKSERKRIDSLHSLLDKTAVYSQFVSSQIKQIDANIQGQQQGTGSGAKRKADEPAPSN